MLPQRVHLSSATWPILACLLTVTGARLWLVRAFGSTTPFWDQWDAEAAAVFKPYLNGTLRVAHLFEAHNEHRIVFTRVLGLVLLELNGSWNPLLELTANVLVCAASLAVLLVLLGRALNPAPLGMVAGFVALMASVPFGWESSLTVLQSQFFSLNLMTFACLLAFHGAVGLSVRWWMGLALGVFAFLCMASGALTLTAILAVGLVQVAFGKRTGYKELLALGLVALLVVLMLLAVPTVHGHNELRAKTAGAFLSSLVRPLSWPFPAGLLWLLVLNLPTTILAYGMVRDRCEPHDPRWLYAGLAAWLLLQSASLAYGRAGVLAPRYLDVIGTIAVLNFASLLYLLDQDSRWSRHLAARMAAAAWVLAVVVSAGSRVVEGVPRQMTSYRTVAAAQAVNLRGFIQTGDFSHLAGKPTLHIPYPSAGRLRDLASDPVIRSILPKDLTAGAPDVGSPQLLLGFPVHRTTQYASTAVLRFGPRLLAFGIAIFLFLGIELAQRTGRTRDPGSPLP
jgi:hypothetical protein